MQCKEYICLVHHRPNLLPKVPTVEEDMEDLSSQCDLRDKWDI